MDREPHYHPESAVPEALAEESSFEMPSYAAESDQPDNTENQPPSLKPENSEQQELIQMQQDFINANRDIFESISKSNRVRIEPGDGFVIIFGEPIVIKLDAKDWQEMQAGNFTEEEMIWSTLHEIAHFLDMMDDPIGMRDHFEYMRNKAKMLVPKTRMIWSQALKAKGQDLPAEVTDTWLQGFLYQRLHTLYNCLDDVYVNNVVASKLPQRYLPAAGRGARVPVIKRLYEDFLFKNGDLTQHAKSQQLAYTILRRHMVDKVTTAGTTDPTIASPEIEAVLQKKVVLPGRKPGSIQSILEPLLRPTTSVEKIQHTPSYRYAILKSLVEPEFWNLFWEDIKNFPPPIVNNESSSEGGETQPGSGETETENAFQPGVKVKDKNTGKIGTILSVSETGEVTVQYEPDETASLGADESGQPNQVVYTNPKEDLIIIKEGKPPKGGKNQPQDGPQVEYTEGSEGEEAKEPIDPWETIGKKNPIDQQDIDEFLKGKAQYEKDHAPKEEPALPKLSPEEAYKAGKIKYDASLAETYGKLDPEKAQEVAEEWDKYYESVKPYINELSEVFDQILNTINTQIIQAWEQGFKSGKFNVNRFIQRYAPSLIAGTAAGNIDHFINFNELNVYAQREFISRLQILPNNIVFRFLLDNSGSMQGDPILAVKQLMVLQYEALKSFEERTNLRFRLNTPFRLDLHVQTFGSETTLAKPRGSYGEAERGQMLATLAFLDASEGDTLDAQAWENINTEIADTPGWAEAIKKGEAKDITIEVTDGDSRSFSETRENMQTYMGYTGADTANGIYLAPPEMTDEQYQNSSFVRLFQGNGQAVKHPSELAPVMAALMKRLFTDLQNNLSVEFESSDDFE